MTDNEIIKALECCLIECGECTVCPLKHIKIAVQGGCKVVWYSRIFRK